MCGIIERLLDQSPDSWTAFWTFWLVAATAALAFIALVQIRAARVENRKTQTLLACGNYDQSRVIFDCHRIINAAQDQGTLVAKAKDLRLEIMTILNFLDAIAIGIAQGLYVEELAKQHLQHIVARQVKHLIDSGAVEAAGCSNAAYHHLIDQNRKWGATTLAS